MNSQSYSTHHPMDKTEPKYAKVWHVGVICLLAVLIAAVSTAIVFVVF